MLPLSSSQTRRKRIGTNREVLQIWREVLSLFLSPLQVITEISIYLGLSVNDVAQIYPQLPVTHFSTKTYRRKTLTLPSLWP